MNWRDSIRASDNRQTPRGRSQSVLAYTAALSEPMNENTSFYHFKILKKHCVKLCISILAILLNVLKVTNEFVKIS